VTIFLIFLDFNTAHIGIKYTNPKSVTVSNLIFFVLCNY